MPWRNTQQRRGWASICFHWITAVTIIGLFILGLWMVDLTYYDDWYRKAPDLHKSTGVLLFVFTLLRLIWRKTNTTPDVIESQHRWEIKLAHITHVLLYALLLSIMLSGYFISTADGRDIEVFKLFSVPATLQGIENQEDIAGKIHLVLAVMLISLASIHALAAVKHHIIDKDRTLKRMLGSL